MKIIRLSLVFVVLLLFGTISILGQSNTLSTPENTIASLFKSMYEGDSILALSVFAEGATLNSVFKTKDGNQKINSGSVSSFVTAIGSPHEEVWDERVSNLKVNIDGDLAQAWMDYSFYVGDKFSHCGVNAMHLIKGEEGWKIFQILDTRRKDDCY